MEENDKKDKNGINDHYSESSGTGVVSAMIFLIVSIIILYLLSRFL